MREKFELLINEKIANKDLYDCRVKLVVNEIEKDLNSLLGQFAKILEKIREKSILSFQKNLNLHTKNTEFFIKEDEKIKKICL